MGIESYFQEIKAGFRKQFGTEFSFLGNTGIYDTPLYRFLEKMPKATDLHTHGDSILPLAEQIAFLKDHPELVITPSWEIRFAGPGVPYGSRTMRECIAEGLTEEDFAAVWTVAGCPPGEYLWDWFEGIFTKCGAVCCTPALIQDYYTRVMLYYHNIGVEYFELKSPFFGTREDALGRGLALFHAMQEVRKQAPLFTLRVVAAAGKNDVWDPQFESLVDNALYVREQVKDGDEDFVVALDIVNDEDRSYSLARYKDRICRIIRENPGFKLSLHAGESLRGENREIEIALSCNTDRLGHGFNLYRYPELLEEVRTKGICMEVCPVSNASLGYCSDFALHPAREYRKAGIPIVICSDDAAYQAKSILTGDYLAVVAGWDLSLEEVKELCLAGIKYAFVTESRRKALLDWFNGAWQQFISSMQS